MTSKTVTAFIEGLSILTKYMKDGDNQSYFLGAEHDQIWIYTEESPGQLTADGQRLDQLGFFYDDDIECWSYYT